MESRNNRIRQKARTNRVVVFLMALLSLFAWNIDAVRAQSQEVQQLLLDVEKLSQFKSILSDMERGYAQLSQGYNAVRNVTQGNFNLHQVFLDGLLTVNPNVKKYRRVADIIEVESSILSEYKKAWKRSNSSGSFSLTELNYISSVYGNLTSQALRNLNDLITVLTASQLRMSDDERLREIDRIYTDISDKLIFLRSFNRQTDMMRLQRSKELSDTQTLQKLYIK